MLVVSRKVGQKIVVGEEVVLVIQRIAGNRVSIGVEAPRRIPIVRGELAPAARRENHSSVERISPGSNAVEAAGADSPDPGGASAC